MYIQYVLQYSRWHLVDSYTCVSITYMLNQSVSTPLRIKWRLQVPWSQSFANRTPLWSSLPSCCVMPTWTWPTTMFRPWRTREDRSLYPPTALSSSWPRGERPCPLLTLRWTLAVPMRMWCVWMPFFELAGGVNLPKVISCVGSDGKRRRQLVKVIHV